MKTASAKQKGRIAVQQVKDLLHQYAPVLESDDIVMPAGSQPGADIHLSPHAKKFYPFAIEVKCQQSIQIWAALKQADSHVPRKAQAGPEVTPILFFKRNHSEMYVALKAEDFMKLTSSQRPKYSERSE